MGFASLEVCVEKSYIKSNFGNRADVTQATYTRAMQHAFLLLIMAASGYVWHHVMEA